MPAFRMQKTVGTAENIHARCMAVTHELIRHGLPPAKMDVPTCQPPTPAGQEHSPEEVAAHLMVAGTDTKVTLRFSVDAKGVTVSIAKSEVTPLTPSDRGIILSRAQRLSRNILNNVAVELTPMPPETPPQESPPPASEEDSVTNTPSPSSDIRVQNVSGGTITFDAVAIPHVSGLGVTNDVLDVLSQAALHEASASNIRVVGASDVESLLGFEKQRELLGCEDASCYVEIAGALGVDGLLVLRVGRLGSTFLVSATLLDLQKAQAAVRADARRETTVDGLLPLLEDVIRSVLSGVKPR